MVKVLNQATGEMEQQWSSYQIKDTNCTKEHFQYPDTKDYFAQLPLLSGKTCLDIQDI